MTKNSNGACLHHRLQIVRQESETGMLDFFETSQIPAVKATLTHSGLLTLQHFAQSGLLTEQTKLPFMSGVLQVSEEDGRIAIVAPYWSRERVIITSRLAWERFIKDLAIGKFAEYASKSTLVGAGTSS